MLLSFSHPPSIPTTQTPPHGDCQDLLTILPVESSEIMYHSDILMMMMSEQEGGREGWPACLPACLVWFSRTAEGLPDWQEKVCGAMEWNQNSICPYISLPCPCSCVSLCCSYTASQGLIFFVSHSINLYELLPPDWNHFKPIHSGRVSVIAE